MPFPKTQLANPRTRSDVLIPPAIVNLSNPIDLFSYLWGTTQEDNTGRSFIARNTGIVAKGSPIVHTRSSLHNLAYRTLPSMPGGHQGKASQDLPVGRHVKSSRFRRMAAELLLDMLMSMR